MKQIILASGSPRRKELLEQIGIEFSVMTSDTDENIEMTQPENYVCKLATTKALAVRDNILSKSDASDKVIIGADTIVFMDGSILTKPTDEEDAKKMLAKLSGKKHQVYTGVAVVSDDNIQTFAEMTEVLVSQMTAHEIEEYVASGEPMDKAGAYGIQGMFARYVEGIKGDYNNVVGLPVAHLYHVLKKSGMVNGND